MNHRSGNSKSPSTIEPIATDLKTLMDLLYCDCCQALQLEHERAHTSLIIVFVSCTGTQRHIRGKWGVLLMRRHQLISKPLDAVRFGSAESLLFTVERSFANTIWGCFPSLVAAIGLKRACRYNLPRYWNLVETISSGLMPLSFRIFLHEFPTVTWVSNGQKC